MQEPEIPPDELERLNSLRKLMLLSSPDEEAFDRITRIASRLFHVPIALVSLIDVNRQWFKSCVGLPIRETPRGISFCGHAILKNGVFVISDAQEDIRFADNPLVTGEPHIRFYAGKPIRSPEGKPIGTLCIIDRNPRRFTHSDIQNLTDLAGFVENAIRLRELGHGQMEVYTSLDSVRLEARIDSLTRTWNRKAIEDIVKREFSHAKSTDGYVSVAMIDLDHFKNVNDTFGHPFGDVVLKEAVRRIRSVLRSQDALARFGGEEFIVCFPNTTPEAVFEIGERIRKAISDGGPVVQNEKSIQIAASIGIASARPAGQEISPEDIIASADAALYEAKESGRNRVIMR